MKRSIKLTLMLNLGIEMIVVSILMTVLIGRTVRQSNKAQIERSVVTLTEKKATTMEMQLMNNVYTAEALGSFLGGSWAIPEKYRRSSIEQEIRSMVKSSHIKSAWAYYMPTWFDNLDSKKIDPDNNPTGQFKVHYISDKTGKIKNETVSELTQAEIEKYTNAWATSVSEPKLITYDEEQVLSVKIFATITNSLSQHVGVAGVDLVLSGLNGMVDGSSIYDSTTCQFISSTGRIIASSDGSQTGTVSEYFSNPQYRKYFVDEDGNSNNGTETFYANVNGMNQFVTVARAVVDKTGAVWYFLSFTPVYLMDKAANRTVYTVIIAFTVQILMVLGIVFFATSRITRPLNKSVVALKNISEGDGDLTVRLKAAHNDEIGQMCESFNKTMGKISDSFKEVKTSGDVMNQIGEELNNSMKETDSAVNIITDSIVSVQDQMQNYAASVEEARATVDQIVKNISILNENIDNQAVNVADSSKSVGEMANSIKSVSVILQNNQESMNDLEEASEVGKALIGQTTKLSSEIQEKSKTLEDASDIIKRIAQQTNLLAMNAAIEASHAGEHGKGFSVVAGEIRKLAEESNIQGQKIQDQLKEVTDIILQVFESSVTVQDQFDKIFNLTKQVSEQEKQIAEAMEQQNQGSETILAAMQQISTITQQVKNGSDEMMEGSRQISTEMDNIADMTNSVNHNMKSMSEKTVLITDSAKKASDCVNKNVESIQKLQDAMGKFKI